MKFSRSRLLVVPAALLLAISATPAHAADLSGSGATFVQGIIEACKSGYNKKTNHSVTYSGTGSSQGRSNSDRSIGDFWFSDDPHLGSTRRATVVNVPIVAAPIAIMHSLPARTQLYLSPETIAGIFSGQITKWNDPKILADNNRTITEVIYKKDNVGNVLKDKNGNNVVLRSVQKNIRYTLPNQDIRVFYRSDGSGTTSNFTRYMNATAPSIWTKTANSTFTTSFPGDINAAGIKSRFVGASGSSAVSLNTANTKYAITYAEESFAKRNGLKVAAVKNASGTYVAPSTPATSAFLNEATINETTGGVTYKYDTTEKGAYTLGIYSFMMLDLEPANKEKGAAVKQWAEYLLSEDCIVKEGTAEGFTYLTGKPRTFAEAQLKKMKL